jgi:hypothetical protein
VKAFTDLNSEFQSIFSVQTFNGLLAMVDYPLRQGTWLSGAAGLRPIEITYHSTPHGTASVQYPRTTLELVLESAERGVTFSMTAFPVQVAHALFTPHRYGALYARLHRTNDRKFVSTIGLRLTLPVVNFRVQSQISTQKVNFVDYQLSVGSNERGACFQWMHRPGGNAGYSTMLYRALPGRTLAVSLTIDARRLFVVRTEREIRNWRIGVNFFCSDMLDTGLEIAWIAKIGRFTVQSALKSWGEVKSSFRAKMTPQATMIVTGELNHEAHAYKFGVALQWDQRQPLPTRPRGWFARISRWVKPNSGFMTGR